ncbi:MAG TPA: hypothetical protein VIJ14_05625 [Rhabdochlamydiaceae bacterium]
MAGQILPSDVRNSFLKCLERDSQLIVTSMFFGVGIAFCALDQIKYQNGERLERMTTIVHRSMAGLMLAMASSMLASNYNNVPLGVLAVFAIGYTFWTVRQISQLNSTEVDKQKQLGIGFATQRAMQGVIAMVALPCAGVVGMAFRHFILQRFHRV